MLVINNLFSQCAYTYAHILANTYNTQYLIYILMKRVQKDAFGLTETLPPVCLDPLTPDCKYTNWQFGGHPLYFIVPGVKYLFMIAGIEGRVIVWSPLTAWKTLTIVPLFCSRPKGDTPNFKLNSFVYVLEIRFFVKKSVIFFRLKYVVGMSNGDYNFKIFIFSYISRICYFILIRFIKYSTLSCKIRRSRKNIFERITETCVNAPYLKS